MFIIMLVFFFKQKTAYEMRISDWSSDVCSSDLRNCYLASPYMDLTLCQPFNMSAQTVKSPLITRAQPTVRTDIIQIVRSFNHLLKSHESIFPVDLNIIADRKTTRLNSSH